MFVFLREIVCEETERFVLSSTNLNQVSDVLKMLENQVKTNQKRHMEMVEKISSLYERLRLDVADKYKFLSVNQVTFKSSLLTFIKLNFYYSEGPQ